MSVKTQTKEIIKQVAPPLNTRFSTGMLVSSSYYVLENTKIEELADEMAHRDNIFALAVVNASMNVQGAIIRKDLFDILGRRFGRELYYNKTVIDVMQKVRTFNYTMHIFECSKIIEKDLITGIQDYYALVDDQGSYRGLFSTKDMLIFLSRLTQKDIEQAKRVINRIVNKEYVVQTKRLRIAIRNEMVQDIGGDSYFIIPKKTKNEIIVGVCDVAGKGIAASMITAIINGMISTNDFETNSIESFLLHLNNYIYSTFEGEKFVTSCFVVINEDESIMGVYDFGHSMAYLYRDGVFKFSLKEINLPLGVQKITNVKSGKMKLQSGDCIYILTDGCIEQRDIKSNEYGIQRFNKMFISNYSDDPSKIVNALMTDIQRFRGTYPQQDDITIACIMYE